jgi:hypothetical protein
VTIRSSTLTALANLISPLDGAIYGVHRIYGDAEKRL